MSVLLCEVEGNLHSLVELNGLAELGAGSVLVGLLVDAGALNLKEEALLIGLKEVNGLFGHCGKLRLVSSVLRVCLALYRRLVEVAVQGCLRSGENCRHVAIVKEPQKRLLLIRSGHLLKLRCGGDYIEALGLCLLKESLPCVLAADSLLIEGLHAAAQGYVRTGLDELLGD